MADLPLFHYQHQQWFPLPVHQVFSFFECPENLALVTPPTLAFRQLTPAPVAMREGTLIDYTIRRFGLRLRWRTLITVYQQPKLFVDEQLNGPYSYWRHEHHFEADKDGTRMQDRVVYALPNFLPNVVARAAERYVIRPQLREIFSYREKCFASLLSDDRAPGSLVLGRI